MMLRLVYKWHPNFKRECERGAYLSFLLVSSVASTADNPRFVQHAEGAGELEGAAAPSIIQIPIDPALGDDWVNVVLFVRLYSYNSISPGIFEASTTSVRTRTWASQRTAYSMIPIECTHESKRYRMRSMLPLDQPPKGWLEIDWAACRVEPASSPLTVLPRVWDALDVAQGKDLITTNLLDFTMPMPTSSSSPSVQTSRSLQEVLHAQCDKPGMLTGLALTRRRQETLQQVCAPWTHAEQLHMDVAAPFICRGLRDKYAPDVYLPIGPVPCMVYLMSLGRASFDERLTPEYVGYLMRGLWPLILPARETSNLTLSPVERLELLHSVATFHAQLRPYKFDAIDVCGSSGNKPVGSVAGTVHADWFDVMEAHDPQPPWSPRDKRQALHNSLVAAETGGLLSPSSSSSSSSSSVEHVCAAGDQIDHDFQGAHMADQSNDCDSRVSSVAIMFDRIKYCSIDDPVAYHHATSLFYDDDDDNDTESREYERTQSSQYERTQSSQYERTQSSQYERTQSSQYERTQSSRSLGLMLSSIAKQYVFVYTIVAALSEYNSLDSTDQVERAAYALRTKHPEVLTTTPPNASQLSEADHTRLWVDPLGFTCHVVGLWFPRSQWRLLCDRGVRFKKGGHVPLVNEPMPPPCDIPAGVCDPSDNTHAMQFEGEGTPSPPTPHAHPYDWLHDEKTGFAHARLVSMQKPRSWTKSYMQYAYAVTACEYTNMRRDPAVGDVIFVNTENRTYGIPFAELMRPDALVPRINMGGGGGNDPPVSSLATFAAEPMTEPLSLQQRHDIQECLNLIPRPAALAVSEFASARDTAASMATFVDDAAAPHGSVAWMTRTNWLQVDPVTSRSYGDLFMDWCKQPAQAAWKIDVSPDFIWIADGCYVRRIRFE